MILVDLTARVKDTGEVIETTVTDEAKKLGVYDESKRYEPRLISVGDGWVLKGVDEALLSAEIGKQITVDITPEKAFGLRDPNKVRRVPLRKFGDKASELRAGDEIEVDNQIGLVRFIGSGRAQVDFNHRYAGKVVTFDLKPLSELKTSEEKATSLLRRRLPVDAEKVSLTIKEGEATIALPQETYLVEGLQIIKRAVSTDLFRYVSEVSKVKFVETYETTKPKEAEKPKTTEPETEKTEPGKAEPEKEEKPKRKAKQAQPQPET